MMDLPRHDVHCWSVHLEISPDRCAELSATLSADELERSARLRTPALRQRFVAAHAGLRAVLSAYTGTPPEQLDFVHNSFGKPALTGASIPRLGFNLSHSEELALVAVAADAELGVDLERVDTVPDEIAITREFFGEVEAEELGRLPHGLRTRAFLRRWTRSEAYAKAIGVGLDAMSLRPDLRAWSLYPLHPAPGFIGALVVEGAPRQVTVHTATLASSGSDGLVNLCS